MTSGAIDEQRFVVIPVRYDELDASDPWGAFVSARDDEPNAPRTTYRLASREDRLRSAVLDIAAWASPTIFAFVMVEAGIHSALIPGDSPISGVIWILALVAAFPLPTLVVWRTDGRPPGKRRTGLRIVSLDGRPLTLEAAAIRQFWNLFGYDIFISPINWISMGQDASGRTMADGRSGTRVVYEAPSASHESS